MAVLDSAEHLPQVELDSPLVLAEVGPGVHELLEVEVEELKDEVEALFAVDDVVEPDHIVLVQLLEHGNLTDGCGGDALFFIL